MQLFLDFSTDHLETMHTCSTWSEDVHVILGLFCHYFLFNFLHFFNLVCFSCDTIVSATHLTVLYQTFWNCAGVFVRVWRCACAFWVIVVIFYQFFVLFSTLLFRSDLYENRYFVGATHLSFPPIIFKLCIFVLHGRKMCIWFWGYLPIIFYQHFSTF